MSPVATAWSIEEAEELAALITAGEFDPYLELLLSAAHARKLTKRSVPGFRMSDRARRAVS